MRKLVFLLFLLPLIFIYFSSCEDSVTEPPPPPPTAKAVYVLNSAATSISVIDLTDDQVYNNIATVGTWPNQLVYHKGKVYCVNSGSNNIMIFDAETWDAETPVDLGAGNNPMNMVFYDDNTVYVSCSVSNKVLQVNMASKTVTKSINAGIGTTGITTTPEGKIYASNTAFDGGTWTYGQGTVTIIDGATGDSLTTINVGTNPQSAGWAPDGNVHVSCTGNYGDESGKVSVINPTTDMLTATYDIGGSPGGISFSLPDLRGYLAIWGMGLMVYEIQTGTVINDANDPFLGKGGSGALVDTKGNVFVSVWDDDQVIKLDKDENVIATYNVGDSPMSLAMKVE